MVPLILLQKQTRQIVIHQHVVTAIMAATCLLTVILGYTSNYWLPSKYSLDQFTISVFQIFAETWVKGNSYNNTALIFNALGVTRDSDWFKGLVTTTFILFATAAMRSVRPAYLTPPALLIFLGSCFASAVYLSPLSKESTVLVLILLFYICCQHRISNMTWMAVALVYAYYFRGYWYMVVAMYAWMLFMGYYARKPQHLFMVVILGLLAISLVHPLVIGGSIMKHRDGVNAGRDIGYVKTLITPFFTTRNVITDWLNCSLIWLQTIFPVRLLVSTSPQHVVSGVMMLSTFGLIFAGIGRFWQATTQDPAIFRCLCLFMAFTAVQSTFEPDYGSMLKHMTPLLPLALVFICSHFKPQAKAAC